MNGQQIEELVRAAIDEQWQLGPVAVPEDVPTLSAAQVAAMIDHTILKPETTSDQVRRMCSEALEHRFAAVCVNPLWVPLVAADLVGSDVKTCAVAGFPLGATYPAVKAFEAQQAVSLGAQEIDIVINIGSLKDGDYRLVQEDIAAVADAVHEGGALLKVIFETGLLTLEEKIAACVICREAGADFVKTATGFAGGGATVEDVALMRRVVGPGLGVKAAGGVRTGKDALAMIAAGANRIGTSGGLRIVQELAGVAEGERAAAGNY